MTGALTNIPARRAAPSAPGAPPAMRLAAIDVGSNSIHMIVAQADADGAVTTLWRMKEPVGLGRASFPSRRLSRVAMDTALNTLARFKQAALQRQAERVVAIATSAVREATNGGDLIERAKHEVGLNLKICSARDEARLIYLGVRHACDLTDRPHLIIDIGGGSVEFIVGDGRRASMLESRKLGASRMTARFVHSDPISKSDREALQRYYDRELTPLCANIEALEPVAVIGTSGTLENIAAMCGTPSTSEGNGASSPGVIERDRFAKLLEALTVSDTKQRSKLRGLDDQRKDQIVAGAMLVGELFERLQLKRFTLCGAALREGILIDYLARHMPDLAIRRDVPDPRRRSVLDLARRCDWHQSHSEHVASLCMKLFDELRALHKLGPVERELIEHAALLHDIGWHIGRTGHHKHSMYLIAHGDLKGFLPEEVQTIANIARYHRKATPSKKHDPYTNLSPKCRRVVDVGSALLRLADGLDRSHAGVITDLRCRIGADAVNCVLNPRSDAELEIWGARRKMKWFEKVFDRDITFSIKK
jgi:exopolyphosphatase / guanosine-5'-triphosphate,3'-diphosphate pyrophosphatase